MTNIGSAGSAPDGAEASITQQESIADRVRHATALLESLSKEARLLSEVSEEERTRLMRAAGEIYCPDVRMRRRLVKTRVKESRAKKVKTDQAKLNETGIRKLRSKPVFTTPNYQLPADASSIPRAEHSPTPDVAAPDKAGNEAAFHATTGEPQNCYICKLDYSSIHHFYDQLCPACAELNFAKRTEAADLRGRVALVTGGRVKIGYQAVVKLLRCGADVIVCTRFPRDAAMRFASEADYTDWSGRVEIFGLDLRHTPLVEAFCQHVLRTRQRLDFIINNACQTVRRPPDFYRHMMDRETGPLQNLPSEAAALLGGYEGLRSYNLLGDTNGKPHAKLDGGLAGLMKSAELSQVALMPEDLGGSHLFPQGRLDQDLQQVDLRDRNSWRLLMAEVPTVELLEVQLINAIAPFIINARLKTLMLRTPGREKHIVNVSAVEGQFYRKFKTTRHPHTNMAKAALNMMTRTSAAEYHADGIHMNSVDTGWVTDEDPIETAQRKKDQHRFHPPLDIVDGAARIVDPIIAGFNTGEHVWGKFLKDYLETPW